MRIGYLIDTNQRRPAPPSAEERRATIEAMVAEGRAAERAGFHSVQVPDRHASPDCFFPGPEQLLTILARETERVALGSFTWVATLTHPMKAAEQFSLIDNLSGGRLFTTVSRGFLSPFWRQFGVPEERLLGRFKEAIEVWRLAATGERFSFAGRHWRVDDGLLAPAPFQAGGWPLWGGGNAAAAAIRRSADYGAAWTCDPLPFERAAWEARADLYRERARELGKRPFVVMMRDGWVDRDPAPVAAFAANYARSLRFYQRAGGFDDPRFPTPESITPDTVRPHLLAGTPDQCIEYLERLHDDLGVDYVTFCCRLATGPSLAATLEQIQAFGEQVVQPLHRRHPAPDHPAIPAACHW